MRSHVAIKWTFGDVPLTWIPMGLLRDRTIINVRVLVITVYFSSLFLWALIKQSPWCEGYVALIGGCQDADHPLLVWCILERMKVRKWQDASGGHLLIVHRVNMWQKMNSSPVQQSAHCTCFTWSRRKTSYVDIYNLIKNQEGKWSRQGHMFITHRWLWTKHTQNI